MVEILVIGVNPPCPRCDLVHRWADEFAAEFEGKVTVKSICYTDEEARAFGREHGMKVGTAHDISKETGIVLDSNALNAWMANRVLEVGDFKRQAELWSPEMDAIIEPCRAAAEPAGWLMTPVIAVNGEVKHHGSVPDKESFRKWIMEAI